MKALSFTKYNYKGIKGDSIHERGKVITWTSTFPDILGGFDIKHDENTILTIDETTMFVFGPNMRKHYQVIGILLVNKSKKY